METNSFAPLGLLQVPTLSKLFPSACCPDKDLVALVFGLSGLDRLSLWNYNNGSKIWEIDPDLGDDNTAEIVALAWGPDGQSIGAAHHPPQITLHSLQDGSKLFALPLHVPITMQPEIPRISDVWWFQEPKPKETSSIPDIFRRKNVITGTAHSILNHLPPPSSLQDDAQKLSAIDLFAFQGSQVKATSKSPHPEIIDQWPTLSPKPLTRSIAMNSLGESESGIPISEDDVNSVLAVADSLGFLHFYLDGSFPLGSLHLGAGMSVSSLSRESMHYTFFSHLRMVGSNDQHTESFVYPTLINMPLLRERHARDLAKLSSTAQESMSYLLRVIKEMNTAWFGLEGNSGARDLGPKWVEALETRQREQFGHPEPNGILDLTALLVTGRASDALLDFLGSSEQTSERGIQKWETSMTVALVKLRDMSEKRIAPACQRLHLVLEEIKGWSQLPGYSLFNLSTGTIDGCLCIIGKIILLAAWLAAVTRRDLSRFKEFISWIRYETTAANPTNENPPQPRHDILEVNNYLTSGLFASTLDSWFRGPIPQFSLRDLGIPDGSDPVSDVLIRASIIINESKELDWQSNAEAPNLEHFDRNVDALIQELARRCKQVFEDAAGATCRSAVVSNAQVLTTSTSKQVSNLLPVISRERIIEQNEGHGLVRYLALTPPMGHSIYLCITRLRFKEALELPSEVAIALLERFLSDDCENDFDLLEAEFFDDESMVIVYQLRNHPRATHIATLTYNDLSYRTLQRDQYLEIPTAEHLLARAIEEWEGGRLSSERHPIKRTRTLAGCKAGQVSLAVNGRVGRRVACVLDIEGGRLESFDIEGGNEDMESESSE